MKNRTLFYLSLLCFAVFSFASCDNNEENIPEKPVVNLPLDAQSFLTYYLSDLTDPEVRLSDASVYSAYYKESDLTVNFDKDGKWMQAETSKVLPSSLLNCLPLKIQKATETFHKEDTIRGIQVKEYGYMIQLQRVRLAYNSEGVYIGYDEVSKTDKLADISRKFIQQYWKDTEVTSVIFNGENYSKRYYLVYLVNNTIIRFDYNKGTWLKIDGGTEPLSKEVLALMPEDIIKGAEEMSKGSPIVSMEVERIGLYSFRFANGNGYTLVTEDYVGEPVGSVEIYEFVNKYIKSHWDEQDQVSISIFTWSGTDPDEYRFFLSNGFECVFDSYKTWILINGEGQEIPLSIQKELPAAVLKCVNDGFFGYKIVKIEKVIEETSKLYYYISLDSDNVILKINSKGELIGYSDKLE